MSSRITYSRDQFYKTYKNSDPEAAKKLIAPAEDLTHKQIVGLILIIVGIATAVFLIAFTALLGGCGAQSQWGFMMTCTTGGACGPFVLGGLILFAVATCKKCVVLHKRLTAHEVNAIAGKSLIDTRRQDL